MVNRIKIAKVIKPINKNSLVTLIYRDLTLFKSPFAKYVAAKFTIVGRADPAGRPKRDIKEIRLANIPYSAIVRFLLTKRLNKKFNILLAKEPTRTIVLPLISGCSKKIKILFFIIVIKNF